MTFIYWFFFFLFIYFLPSFVKLPNRNSSTIFYYLIFLIRLPGLSIRVIYLTIYFLIILAILAIVARFLKQPASAVRYIGPLVSPIGFFLMGVQLKVESPENFDKLNRAFVLVFNHQSFFDVILFCPVATYYFPYDVVGVAKKSLKFWPGFGVFWRSIGGVFVDNSSPAATSTTSSSSKTSSDPIIDNVKKAHESSIRSLKEVEKKIVEENVGIIVAPEGHRNSERTLLPFKTGAFHMAINANRAPILPLVAESYYDKLMECNFPWNRQTIVVRVLPPIPTDNVTDVKAFAEEVRSKMQNTLDDLNKMKKTTENLNNKDKNQ